MSKKFKQMITDARLNVSVVDEIQRNQENKVTKKEYKLDGATADLTKVNIQFQTPKREVKTEQKHAVKKPLKVIQPRPLYKPYQYRDQSAAFYKTAYNREAEAQEILVDAQQQAVHGQRTHILDSEKGTNRPSSYEQSIRQSAHVKYRDFQQPFHERAFSAPDTKRRIEY